MASVLLSRWERHDGNKRWRGTTEDTLLSLSLMTKLAKTYAHRETQSHSQSHLLFSLNLSLSYIQRAGPADPCTEPSHPSVCPPSALCASWFRPAVVALAASGTDPPHFNASDIYLGRTTRERGGGGEGLCTTQWMWILLMRISLTPPPS